MGSIYCNIGESEIRNRRRVGYIFLFLLIVLLIIFLITKNQFLIPLIFVSTFSSSLGFIQSYLKFCIYWGILGKNDYMSNIQIKVYNLRNILQIIGILLICTSIAFLITQSMILLS